MTRRGQQGESAGRAVSGLDIALEWAELPPEHLVAALKALEPQLAREHELKMSPARFEHEARMEELKFQEVQAARVHSLYLSGLIAGFVMSAGMLVGSVLLGTSGYPWLSALLAGPSLLSLAAIFVLRRNDAAQMRAVARAQQAVLNAAVPPPDPQGQAGLA